MWGLRRPEPWEMLVAVVGLVAIAWGLTALLGWPALLVFVGVFLILYAAA